MALDVSEPRYPNAERIVAGLKSAQTRFRYARRINRPYASDNEAILGMLSASAHAISGEYGQVLAGVIGHLMGEIEELRAEVATLKRRGSTRRKGGSNVSSG